MFKTYIGKAIKRQARKITADDKIHELDSNTAMLVDGSVVFKFHQPIAVGDYIVRLTEADTYHCSAEVFHERNIVSDEDQTIENDFASTYPKVSVERIDELMSRVVYDVHVCEGSTTTVVTAMLPIHHINFSLCTEIMACVDPRNFNAALGAKYGIQKAERSARNKLWELEGYKLANELFAQ